MADPTRVDTAAAKAGAAGATAAGRRRLALRGSAWVLGAQAVSQLLRLASNLLLTRLLAPELFGLMALVNVVNRGANMFADVGLRGNVVHHREGDEPLFLDTVFSVQAIRGVLLWAVICALAWPAARFFEEPALLRWIPIVGFCAVLGGFQSTALHTTIRRVQPQRRIPLDLGSQALSVAVMVVWAWVAPGMTALVAGSLVSAAVLTLGSHWIYAGYRNRFRIDRGALRDILRFGRWILISTALTFLLLQADRLILGKLLDVATLGVYTIAAMLASMLVEVATRLAVNILFPLFARVARDDPGRLRTEATRLTLGVWALSLPPLWALAVAGPEIVELLYDPRYAAAGGMVRILAVGSIASVLAATQERLLLALGRSDQQLGAQAIGAAAVVGGMLLGAMAGGLMGVLVGLAVGRWIGYAALVVYVRHHRLWNGRSDLLAIGVSALVIGMGLALRGGLP